MRKNSKFYLCIFIPILFLAGCNILIHSNGDDTDQPPTPAPVPTPDDIVGFFVQDGKLFDGNGNLFQMRGVNANHGWNATGTDNDDQYIAAIAYMKATGVNTTRIVFCPGKSNPPSPWENTCFTTAQRRRVVEEYIKYHIVPLVEYHNATGFNSSDAVYEAVDFWIGEKEWLDEYGKYVILNITNEWGMSRPGRDDTEAISYDDWAETYKTAITKLREAGIKNLLVIDSFNFACSAECILEKGQEVLDHDPMHNVLFSIHSYGGWWSSQTDPSRISNSENQWGANWNADYAMDLLEEQELPFIFGEFSRNCARIDGGSEAAPDEELIADFDAHGAGWLFWMWHNYSQGAQVQMMNKMDSFSYTQSGKVIADLLKGSPEASIFSEAPPVPPLPELGEPDPDYNPGAPYIDGLIDGAPDLIQIRFERPLLDANPELVPSHLEMELQNNGPGDTSRYWLAFRGWKYGYGTRELQPDEFMGKTVRFWIYTEEGSVARTEWDSFEHLKVFDIDTSY